MTPPVNEPPIELPPSWRRLLELNLGGVIMIVGAPDSGKTTLARSLYSHLAEREAGAVAYLDADPGQSSLGPPTTLSVGLSKGDQVEFPPEGRLWHWFVGSTSPAGHMLPHLVGVVRLNRAARQAGARTVILDTCGLIETRQGGHVLKTAEVDLLQPAHLLALQEAAELEPILRSQRRSQAVSVHELDVPAGIRRRTGAARAENRAKRYRRHFEPLHRHRIQADEWPVFPPLPIDSGRLVGLLDSDGFALALAVAEAAETGAASLTLQTGLASLELVASLRLADVLLDLRTFTDRLQRLPAP